MTLPGRTAVAVALLVAASLAAAPLWADEPSAITLTVRNGLISLEARTVPLRAVVEAITERTGVRVLFDGSSRAALDELVDIAIQDVPVENALRLLLRGRNLVFVYGPARLAEARVYARAQATASAVPPAASVSSTPRTGSPGGGGPAAAAPRAMGPATAAPAARPSGPPADAATLAGLQREVLEHPDPVVRGRALESIVGSGDAARARDAALAMLDREPNSTLLQRALDLLAEDRTIPLDSVIKLALANPTPEVRVKALIHLGADAGRDARVRQTLEASAANDPAPNVRDAARALLQQLPPR